VREKNAIIRICRRKEETILSFLGEKNCDHDEIHLPFSP